MLKAIGSSAGRHPIRDGIRFEAKSLASERRPEIATPDADSNDQVKEEMES
jgi:hypothetical protein